MMLAASFDFLRTEDPAALIASVERLVAAAFLGGLIGLEREIRHKAAGLRTNMLICVGACMYTILSSRLAGTFSGDHTRVAAQVVVGIGFIGAGTILRERGAVFGLTTAATIFVAASIGMAVGGGFYWTAASATGILLASLVILGKLEDRFERRRNKTRLTP